jgi:hypothetical protein
MFPLLKFNHTRYYAKPLLFTSLVICLHIIAFAQVAPTSAEDRMKAVQQRKDLEKRSVVNDISFRNIGPVTMSGRVDDIEANPDDPTEFYVAYASGGCGTQKIMAFPSNQFLILKI